MEDSLLIRQAKAKVQAVREKPLSVLQLKDEAIQLAALLLKEARRIQTPAEKKQQQQLARMMNDPIGKVFTTQITDQCFRSSRPSRVADQLTYVIRKYGVPGYLPADRRYALKIFKVVGRSLSHLIVPVTVQMLRKETSGVILPGEEKLLVKYMEQRRKEGVRVNLNHLGEAILGEGEARHRLDIYLKDLSKPQVEYISVKISTIFSQIHLLAWDETVVTLAERLRELYRAAMTHEYVRPDGTKVPKFVNLDMEEYRDLRLTVDLFKKVLDEPEFHRHSAGIVLQTYLPDSFAIQQELTEWAVKRVANGGAPIKIRVVKGANLAMEQVESALRLWPQAPYISKKEVDANYKRMITYGCKKEFAQAAHLGIASHNLFDIAYALLLRSQNEIEKEVSFEMLEGMADHMRRVVQALSGDMLLYCPAATKEEFQNAVAYLVRRLDENTAPENFLRHAFDLVPDTAEWDKQAELFSQSCLAAHDVSSAPRRKQDRALTQKDPASETSCFQNEADTDWSLPQNRRWVEEIVQTWKKKTIDPIPLVIGGQQQQYQTSFATGDDPSLGRPLYQYSLAKLSDVNLALETAKKAEASWAAVSIKERSHLLAVVAQKMREQRGELIGAMIADTGKTVNEADVEISEAIDFAEYYRRNVEELHNLVDIEWRPKGTVLVAPPWNFPCSIPAGGILAALATGNCVIFKPPSESVLVGWILAQIFWEAGVSKEVLQFLTCQDDPVGSELVKDSRIDAVILTGATATAKLLLKLRPGLDLMAETGGKNAMIITGMSDRDLAIKDLIHSAFGHAGQKCSACSLAILEAEVYDDPHFRKHLRDAASSLAVGSAWDLKTRVNPLIHAPGETLYRGLTTLEEGEEWLLEPKMSPDNKNLWSPGIKLGVKPSSFTFQNELFGPVLALVRAKDLTHAIELANQTNYGLTGGIHSLDEREQKQWLDKIKVGNYYVNRTITGAIVQRQPFGGCKDSGFGKGSKAGGPNYLIQLLHPTQTRLPQEREILSPSIMSLAKEVEKRGLVKDEERDIWQVSLGNAAFYWNYYFSKMHDPSLVLGQDNFFSYAPHPQVVLRVQNGDSNLDILRVIAAAITCGTPLEISAENNKVKEVLQSIRIATPLKYIEEDEKVFEKRLMQGTIKRVRLLQTPSESLKKALAEAACHVNLGQVMANARLELLHYVREKSTSIDYHRYGNLGTREQEKRAPLPGNESKSKQTSCGACCCHG